MPGQESPAELRPGLQWNEETLWFDALQSLFGVGVFFPFFLCICIPGSPGEFIYLLHEEEGEAGQGAKLKNGSSTRYCKERDAQSWGGGGQVWPQTTTCRVAGSWESPQDRWAITSPQDPRGAWPVPEPHAPGAGVTANLGACWKTVGLI